MDIKKAAEKEIDRMEKVFSSIKVTERPKAKEFHDFSQNYFKDSKHFYEKGKYIESFEASIISWAYIDIGLKLKFFKITKEINSWFTSE